MVGAPDVGSDAVVSAPAGAVIATEASAAAVSAPDTDHHRVRLRRVCVIPLSIPRSPCGAVGATGPPPARDSVAERADHGAVIVHNGRSLLPDQVIYREKTPHPDQHIQSTSDSSGAVAGARPTPESDGLEQPLGPPT
ncbi:hypothetical protein GCM10027271_28210 [Saccharopolyspora gloriosae]